MSSNCNFAILKVSLHNTFAIYEATSAIDIETEKIIQDAIQKVLVGRTSFVIAHRLSTIRSADNILVIEDGKIIEWGQTLLSIIELK